ALEVEGLLEPVEINFGDQEIEGLKFKGLKIGVGGKVTVGPQWKKIIADQLKGQLKQEFEKWAERAAVSIGAEVIITGSFIVCGIATIAGAVYQIIYACKLKELGANFKSNRDSMEAGFRAGMSGNPAPSDQFGQAGHKLGQQNLQDLFERTKRHN